MSEDKPQSHIDDAELAKVLAEIKPTSCCGPCYWCGSTDNIYVLDGVTEWWECPLNRNHIHLEATIDKLCDECSELGALVPLRRKIAKYEGFCYCNTCKHLYAHLTVAEQNPDPPRRLKKILFKPS